MDDQLALVTSLLDAVVVDSDRDSTPPSTVARGFGRLPYELRKEIILEASEDETVTSELMRVNSEFRELVGPHHWHVRLGFPLLAATLDSPISYADHQSLAGRR
jgi:hypothetical protein